MTRRTAVCFAAALCLAGCSALPAFGPAAEAIDRSDLENPARDGATLPFRVIDVTAATLPPASKATASFPAAFRNQGFKATDELIGIGDELEIRIWEVAEDGLFASGGNRMTSLPVRVSNSGRITVPYANAVEARGLTVDQLRSVLLERYRGQAIEPEIAVKILSTEARSVTVLGEVASPGRIPVPPRGLRLLDLLAQAGGPKHLPWEVEVSLQRQGLSASLPLSDIQDSAANNIVVLPGDTVIFSHKPRRFAVYGGVSRPSNIEIPAKEADLAYLLAEAGGLDDQVARVQSVFVFRPASGGGIAMAYRFDFSRPDALLLARSFRLAPGDIVYVASAGGADFRKFVTTILSPLLGTANSTSRLRD
ncbi:polysaccharide biosynthesis/export family protein [Tabrizicola sp. YIM 78059]|uniref:polysaccharide biosynthesis/export family protein n=1 Tax=Tabrizicola sp. YIM 78059 TaxID=2529861 RepID=UPI00145A70C6|nr:polysaccharide biosynthesis/export family protein [Tabrizicola sp. YIM 78059]